LFAHCASVEHGEQVLVAWLQTGLVPLHCESVRHATHAPEESQYGVAPLFAVQAASLAHAVHSWLVPSQIGAVLEHCVLAVHWFERLNATGVGAFGVVAATA